MSTEQKEVSGLEPIKDERFVEFLSGATEEKVTLHLLRFSSDRDLASAVFCASTDLHKLPPGGQERMRPAYAALLSVFLTPSFSNQTPEEEVERIKRQRNLICEYFNIAFTSTNPDIVQKRLRKLENPTLGEKIRGAFTNRIKPIVPTATEIQQARGTLMTALAGLEK